MKNLYWVSVGFVEYTNLVLAQLQFQPGPGYFFIVKCWSLSCEFIDLSKHIAIYFSDVQTVISRNMALFGNSVVSAKWVIYM